MSKQISTRVAALALSMATACVTTNLTTAGRGVRVTSRSDTVKDCIFVGEVKGSDLWNGGNLGQGAAEENADRLRNAAGDMGANVVLLGTSTMTTSGSTKRGEASASDVTRKGWVTRRASQS